MQSSRSLASGTLCCYFNYAVSVLTLHHTLSIVVFEAPTDTKTSQQDFPLHQTS